MLIILNAIAFCTTFLCLVAIAAVLFCEPLTSYLKAKADELKARAEKLRRETNDDNDNS